jgi:hypothetical protein
MDLPVIFAAAVAEVKEGRTREEQEARYRYVLRKFFDDAHLVVESRIGTKAEGEGEYLSGVQKVLAAELLRLNIDTTSEVGRAILSTFRPQRVLSWLRAHSEGQAQRITLSLLTQVEGAAQLANAGQAVDDLFEERKTTGTVVMAQTLTTEMRARGAVEAGKQAFTEGRRVTKTWYVTSANPRRTHAALNGKTIGVDERFPNGMLHPGDPAGGIDETAGCTCRLTIKIEEG